MKPKTGAVYLGGVNLRPENLIGRRLRVVNLDYAPRLAVSDCLLAMGRNLPMDLGPRLTGITVRYLDRTRQLQETRIDPDDWDGIELGSFEL
jgi:hypothetical protein